MLIRSKMPGLRRISRQVINVIRRSRRPLSYKELSDLVTEKNYEAIIEEVQKRKQDEPVDPMEDSRV